MYDISFLSKDVRQSIIWDVVEVSRNPSGHGAGWFGVPRQVFCFVDFLGSVAYNNSPNDRGGIANTRKAVRFIQDFFPSDYRQYANLIVAMWRHGTVHGFMPYGYYALSGGRRVFVYWTSNNDCDGTNRSVNLRFLDDENRPDVVYMAINTCELADDLLYALDKMILRMVREPAFGRACVRRLNRALKTRYVMSKELPIAARRQVESQILAAPKATVGVLVGDQVSWY